MKALRENYKDWLNKRSPDDEILQKIFSTYMISEETLASHGLTIEYECYGIWKLREGGQYLMEGEETDCYERASEIIDKNIENGK